MRGLFCSSGVMVGRKNNYNYKYVEDYFPLLCRKGLISGGEFIILGAFYDKLYEICNEIRNCGVSFDVIHCDKDIGIMFSECNDKTSENALALFEENCRAADILGCTRMVFHLWGGLKSDTRIEYNISLMPDVISIAKKHGVKLMIENIPSVRFSGLENQQKLLRFVPDIAFIFDVRFGAFHDEIEKTLNDPLFDCVEHIHISDYGAAPRDFSKIRPILHPTEGKIDFAELFSALEKKNYNGTFTLESPVMTDDGIDIDKLEKTLAYLNKNLKNYNLI